ncbi:MAG: phosphate signaling complex protein PhoU [Candidatus Dadabacteria bacterium]|nr:phosphate signaling complex protein PhoU [Candidatus Dadabacteria bacterium]
MFEMALFSEEMIAKSVRALKEKSAAMAREVIETDERVDEMEIEIDNSCIRILALYQPEAKDLRTVLMVLKINNELERIGDHAVNIAEQAVYLADKPSVKPLIDIPRMAEYAIVMLKNSLDSFVNKNSDLAVEVCKKDDDVDDLYEQVIRELVTYMLEEPTTIERALSLILVGGNLERVADLATNIAEDTYYIVQGKTMKHHALERES